MFIMLTVLLLFCKIFYNSLFLNIIQIYSGRSKYFTDFEGLGVLAT